MKTYDYKKAKQLIEQSKDCLESASIGMHEDWFWTAQAIWEDGEFKAELPDNADELQQKYIRARINGLSMFLETKGENGLSETNPEFDKYTKHQIGGLYGSNWATPTLQLNYKDGDEKMIPCYNTDGSEVDFGEKIEKQILCTSGCMSSKVQANITPLSNI